MKSISKWVAGVVLLAGMAGSHTSKVTYDFTVTAITGPLASTVASGSFSYNTGIIPPNWTWPASGWDKPNLLTSFSLTWNGVTCTASTACTGGSLFQQLGALYTVAFGDACYDDGTCAVGPAGNGLPPNDPFIAIGVGGEDFFNYWSTAQGLGTVQFAAVPVPAAGWLLRGGFGGLRLSLRRNGEELR